MEDITMKKTYINPTIEVFKIHTTAMLAASPDGTANGLDTSKTVGAGDIDARDFDFDDED